MPRRTRGTSCCSDRSNGRMTHVWNSLCSNRHHLIDPPASCPASDSAIWGRAGAVLEPGRQADPRGHRQRPVGNANDHATTGVLNIYRLPR